MYSTNPPSPTSGLVHVGFILVPVLVALGLVLEELDQPSAIEGSRWIQVAIIARLGRTLAGGKT